MAIPQVISLKDDIEDTNYRPPQLAEIVWLETPGVENAIQAALAGVDSSLANAGAALLVATCLDALDDIVCHIDRPKSSLLVAIGRVQRMISLGKMVVRRRSGATESLVQQTRLVPIQLTEHVMQVANKIERSAEASEMNWRSQVAPLGQELTVTTPNLDAKFVRRIIHNRQQRNRLFESDVFLDPAWDMLLDLFAAQKEGVKVSVTSLCIASGVPSTTALRWIGQMIEEGLLHRHDDELDRRRAFLTMTDRSIKSMTEFFATINAPAAYIT